MSYIAFGFPPPMCVCECIYVRAFLHLTSPTLTAAPSAYVWLSYLPAVHPLPINVCPGLLLCTLSGILLLCTLSGILLLCTHGGILLLCTLGGILQLCTLSGILQLCTLVVSLCCAPLSPPCPPPTHHSQHLASGAWAPAPARAMPLSPAHSTRHWRRWGYT